jgi:hypothetical protein
MLCGSEETYPHLADVEVNELGRLMGHKAAEVASNKTMPPINNLINYIVCILYLTAVLTWKGIAVRIWL